MQRKQQALRAQLQRGEANDFKLKTWVGFFRLKTEDLTPERRDYKT